MPILIVALNPSIDVEWRVKAIRWEEKNTLESERRWAGGKGINVARWLAAQGGRARLLLPLGGRTGAELNSYLRRERIRAIRIPIRQATRENVVVTTDAARQLRFNPAGPELSEAEWIRVCRAVDLELAVWGKAPADKAVEGSNDRLLILSGSLPRGLPLSAYAKLIRIARRRDVRSILDCDGDALRCGVKARPFLVKPNEHELEQWWMQPLRSETDCVSAARALSRATGGWVFVSRGAKRALLVNESSGDLLRAQPRRVKTRNTVGAGDALLSAVAWQIQAGTQPADWLQAGLDMGRAAVQVLPGKLPRYVGRGSRGQRSRASIADH